MARSSDPAPPEEAADHGDGDRPSASEGQAIEPNEAVEAAIDELYSLQPDEFMARRTELVKQARAEKEREAAKQIGALRKPTRSAAALNHLVRRDPEVLDELLDLGDALRRAERSTDVPHVRELSRRRRRLIDAAVRRAVGADEPAAVRDEVTQTLQAALAEESVAEQIRSGALVRAASFEGFGFPGAPELAVVTPVGILRRPTRRPADAARAETAAPKGGSDGTDSGAAAARERDEEAARRRAEREAAIAHRKAQDAAQAALDDAERAAADATRAEREIRSTIRHLEDELYAARRALDDARAAVKRTAAAAREARLAVDRLD